MKNIKVGLLLAALFLASAGLLIYPGNQLQSASGGTLSGKVTVKSKGLFGKKGAKGDASNIVVFLDNLNIPDPTMTRSVIQKGKKFTPRVVPIVVGGRVRFPNFDPFNHNIFSPTPGYKFDLGYYGSGQSKIVKFPKTGAVRIYCNIHSNMVTDILVVPNKYFAQTTKSGSYSISGIPPGKYTIVAWQPTGASERRNIKIKSGKTNLNFTVEESVFSLKHKNKYGQSYEQEY